MKEDTGRRKKKRRKKKSRFGRYLYAVIILLLTFSNLTLAVLLLTHVQGIKVEGNERCKKDDIIAWIRDDPLTVNSLYIYMKYKSGEYDMPIYLKSATVKFEAPWALKVKVSEKQIIACVIDGSDYVYFDEEGLVLKKDTVYDESVPIIEGIHAENTKEFGKINTGNKKVFTYIMRATQEVRKNHLNPGRIVWTGEGMELYFDQVCVQLGKTSFDEKVKELTFILKNLEGRNGILQMEHYTSGSMISFKENTG